MYKRYPVRNGVVAFMETVVNKLGHVEEISKGGMSFRYMQIGDDLYLSDTINLFFPRYDFNMNRIPIKLITDIEEFNPSQFRTVTMRRCGVQFLELSDDQNQKLDYFIRNYTIRKKSQDKTQLK
ncbi:MAG: PilZ domain-containing protein [Proteobacteria bacterium]|nr:PilZ domain-containing protein [Pseudomonadota bacterium]